MRCAGERSFARVPLFFAIFSGYARLPVTDGDNDALRDAIDAMGLAEGDLLSRCRRFASTYAARVGDVGETPSPRATTALDAGARGEFQALVAETPLMTFQRLVPLQVDSHQRFNSGRRAIILTAYRCRARYRRDA